MKRLLTVVVLVSIVSMVLASLDRPVRSVFAEGENAAEFISQKGCKKCHFKQHRSWKKTVHANAMDILKPGESADAKTAAGLDPAADYTADPACLRCHTTGYGTASGYPVPGEGGAIAEADADRAKNNAGVGCEACHGAGSLYSPYKKDNEEYQRADVVALGLVTPVTAENCTGCHNSESPTAGDDYVFDFEAAKGDEEAIHAHVDLKFPH